MIPSDPEAPLFLLDPLGEVSLRPGSRIPESWKRDTMLWLLTIEGSAYYSKSGRPSFLRQGTILACEGPLHRKIKIGEEEKGWKCVYLVASNEMTKARMAYVARNFGEITRTSLDSPCVKLARSLVSQQKKLDLWSRSLLAFRWFHAWWHEFERHNLEIRRLLGSQSTPRECAKEIFSLKNLADQLGYSPSYLSRLLGKKWRQSPAGALRKARLEFAARELRETEIRVSALASQLGYLSDSAFIRAFRQAHGLPPEQYRARRRKNPKRRERRSVSV